MGKRGVRAAELRTIEGSTDRAGVLAQAAAFLRDLPAAWDAATPKERNARASLVFRAVEIKDDHVEAIIGQPDFAPFFFARAAQDGVVVTGKANGPDGSAPSTEVLNGRKRQAFHPRRHIQRGRQSRRTRERYPKAGFGDGETLLWLGIETASLPISHWWRVHHNPLKRVVSGHPIARRLPGPGIG